MLEFMAGGHWLAVVPAPAVAGCLIIGLTIFALRKGLIHHPGHREVHDLPNGLPEVAMFITVPGFRGAYVVGLVSRKELQAIAGRLIPPPATRYSCGQA